jgi:hypothetical protein
MRAIYFIQFVTLIKNANDILVFSGLSARQIEFAKGEICQVELEL